VLFERNMLHLAKETQLNELVDLVQNTEDLSSKNHFVYAFNEELDITKVLVSDGYRTYSDDDDDDEEYYDDNVMIHDSLIDAFIFFDEYVKSHMVLKMKGDKNLLMSLAENIVSGNKDALSFYGILITDGAGNFVNPLHPIVAKDVDLDGEYTIMLYPTVEKFYYFGRSFKGIMLEMASCVHEAIPTPSVASIDKDIIKQCINQLSFNDALRYEFDEHDGEKPLVLLTPAQVIQVNGIAYPYYGAIESMFMYASYSSRNLSPMMNGNINTDYNESIYTSDNFVGTCTGNYKPNNPNSFYVMNIVNANSMYSTDIIPDFFADVVRDSIEVGFSILKGRYT